MHRAHGRSKSPVGGVVDRLWRARWRAPGAFVLDTRGTRRVEDRRPPQGGPRVESLPRPLVKERHLAGTQRVRARASGRAPQPALNRPERWAVPPAGAHSFSTDAAPKVVQSPAGGSLAVGFRELVGREEELASLLALLDAHEGCPLWQSSPARPGSARRRCRSPPSRRRRRVAIWCSPAGRPKRKRRTRSSGWPT